MSTGSMIHHPKSLIRACHVKRIMAWLISLLMIITLTGCGTSKSGHQTSAAIKTYKDIPGVTEEEIASIEAIKAVKTRFEYGACPASEAFIPSDGTITGFAQMFCELLSDLFGIEFYLELYPWDQLLLALDARELDFTGELTPTSERMRHYGMTLPIAERMLRIFTLTDSDVIQKETDVDGCRVAFLVNSVSADAIRDAYHLSFDTVEVEQYETAVQMLLAGEIDAFIDEASSDPAFQQYEYIHSRTFFPLVHSSVSMATANLELLPVISVISKYIDAGGVDILYDLYRQGEFLYSKYKLQQSFTDEEKAYIEDLTQRGAYIAVAYEHDNYPISFYNEKENEFQGISVDVLAEISRLTGMQFTPAVTKETAWDEIYQGLLSGDLHMSAQLLHTEERKEHFIWSDVPYARSFYAILSRLSFPYLAPYQVTRSEIGVTRGSGKKDIYVELFHTNANLREFDTQYECLDALESGDIDLLMASEYTLLAQNNYREKSGFKINIKLDAAMDSYFGFTRSNAVLCSIINKAQQYIQTDMIEISWTGRTFDYSKKLSDERTLYLMVFLIVVFAVLLLTVFVLIRNVRLSKKLREIASHDTLTSIMNRSSFLEQAAVHISRSLRLGSECFITILDLDHFKRVNDTYGHLAGDKVLKEVAHRIKKAIRPYDLFGRYGGEEFIMFMPDTDKVNVITATERIRKEVCSTPVIYDEKAIHVSASFGIACAAPANDLETATRHADEALYRAKEAGRNRVVFYENESAAAEGK